MTFPDIRDNAQGASGLSDAGLLSPQACVPIWDRQRNQQGNLFLHIFVTTFDTKGESAP